MSVTKRKHRKHIFIYILTLVFSIGSVFLLSETFAQDLMEQAFSTARSYDTIVDLGNTKDAVGNEVLRESVTVGVNNNNMGQGCFINGQHTPVNETQCAEQGGDWNIQAMNVGSKAPLLVRITKFLLRMTIVLSVTMIIFTSVKYLIEVLSGKDWKSAAAKKDIMRVAGGVIIALMSVGIINLIVSIPKSSIKTSDDLNDFEFGCQIDATIVDGNNFVKWVCDNVYFSGVLGELDEDRLNSDKCYIEYETQAKCDFFNGKRGTVGERRDRCYITNKNNLESFCVEEMGGNVVK
ncbi:MAG TPA: hypothetical protein VJ892_02915 [Candidatus Absconditabacterales bacterium]|nr:hypothetical protein [Candidatus Absconditabacterales bacterium]